MLAERGQMLRTERTSIRRRLAVRRAANRPPWGARKAGHGSIVAPLAATLAATVAIGVGVAMARSERDRRAARERQARDRHFGLLAGEQIGEGLRRMALGQLDIAIESLAGNVKGSPEKRLHETRKALKRLRALLLLLEDELGEATYARESAVVREAGRRLARARDAEVLLSTLDGLVERHPSKLGGRRGVQRLRARLQIECDGAAQLALSDSATRAGTLDELRVMRVRVSAWQLARPEGIEAVEPALERLYKKGRRRMRRAEGAKANRAGARKLHEWRKRVKDLRYAAEMLDRDSRGKSLRERLAVKGESGARKGASGARKPTRARADRAFVGEVAQRADDLGELLGEEHDLAVLAERVRAEAKATRAAGALGSGSRKALLRAIAKRRRRLRRRALREGGGLYGSSPRKFMRRVRAATTLAAISRR
jgi:CHAD domain-containing protein